MIEPQELRSLIKATLTPIGLYSPEAEELLMATAAQESHLGTYRRQIGGPALGIFQMEPNTFNDIWANYLHYKQALSDKVRALATYGFVIASELMNNDPFAIAMARLVYLRAPEPLPASTDIEGMWTLYKLRYNSPKGAATHDEFVANYKRYVA